MRKSTGKKNRKLAEYYRRKWAFCSVGFRQCIETRSNGMEPKHFVPHQKSSQTKRTMRCKVRSKWMGLTLECSVLLLLKRRHTKPNRIWIEILNSIGRIFSCHSLNLIWERAEFAFILPFFAPLFSRFFFRKSVEYQTSRWKGAQQLQINNNTNHSMEKWYFATVNFVCSGKQLSGRAVE